MPIVSQGTTQEFRVGATDGIFVKCTGSAAITYDGEYSAPTLADASTGEVRCGYFGAPATIRVNCVSGTCEVNTQPTVIKPLVSKQGGAAQDSSALDVAQAVNGTMDVASSAETLSLINSVGASGFKALFTSSSYTNNFSQTTISGCLTGGFEISPLTKEVILVSRARRNFITNPSFSGATAGVKGAGGVLPTSWNMSNTAFNWEVVSVSSSIIRLRIFRTGGTPVAQTNSFRFQYTMPTPERSGLSFYANVSVVSQSGIDRVRLLHNNDTLSQSTDVSVVPFGRTVAFRPSGAAGNNMSARVDIIAASTTNDFDITMDISMPMIEFANNASDITYFTASQTAVGTSGASIVDSSFLSKTNILNTGDNVLFIDGQSIDNPSAGYIGISSIFKSPVSMSESQQEIVKNYILNTPLF